MTSIDDLVGHTYGNTTNNSEKEEEQQSSSDCSKGKDRKKKNDSQDQTRERQKQQQCIAYKYSSKGKGLLYESAIVAGLPIFLMYENGEFKTVKHLQEASRIIRPPSMEAYPYEPYEFANMEEVKSYGERARKETIDSLYNMSKSIVAKYNDQDNYKLNLIGADIVWSYFQDKFSTTHYLGIVGDNGSGKSTVGDTFEAIGYRPVNMTDPTAANLFRVLGAIELGQCTIIADEADKMDKSAEIMSILKTGYSLIKKVTRTNTNTFNPEFFNAYCFKIYIAEKSPNQTSAKGIKDRTFEINTYNGSPRYDIKEVLNPSGGTGRQKLYEELIDFRKLMIIYRLIHFKDPITDIDIGLNGRNRELCKPLIQLFYNTSIQGEIESTLQKFIDAKNQRKENTIEAALYCIIDNVISSRGKEVSVADLWNTIKDTIEGTSNENKPNEYHTADYGIIYRNTISNIICDKFGAKRKHREKGNVLIFDLEKVSRVGRAYNSKINIQTKIIVEDTGSTNNPEKSEGSEGSAAKDANSTDNVFAENVGITTNSNEKQTESEQNTTRIDTDFTQEERNNMTAYPTKPSDPSEPSASIEQNTIVSAEEFFHEVADIPYEPLPEHTLEQSPCHHIIDKNQNLYFCRLHPEIKNVNLESIEHHCKYKDPDYHKSEILKLSSAIPSTKREEI